MRKYDDARRKTKGFQSNVRRLLRYLRPRRTALVGVFLAAILSTVS
ncbi:hypothetical protein [Exiguobacterium acetylicum]|nr:hypothetical protein [Exiguobacterium acetylicum]